ncbi:MAG: SAM-dependent methyltransferase, partial [Alphaproteobacteria bacterium]|nr:SAM-dependent methyltransferase [Alphaproteobacteria bacterium]
EPTSIMNYGSYLRVSAAIEGTGAAVTVDLVNKAPQWGPVVTKKHRALTEKVRGALGTAAG